jgi:hypothetical protein
MDNETKFKLTEEKIKALRELEIARLKAEIKEIKSQYGPFYLLRRRIADSRTFTIAAFIFLNMVVVEIYCMWAMIKLQDISAIGGLISAVISEGFVFAIYCYKSFRSKKEEIASKLARDRFEFEKSIESNNDTETFDELDSENNESEEEGKG